MRIASGEHVIEMHLREVLPAHLPSAGDVHFDFRASINSYIGWGSCWVEADRFAAFCAAVRRLQSGAAETACLTSLSPGEMTLAFAPGEDPGFVRVRFSCAKGYPLPCSMSGEFEIARAALSCFDEWDDAS